MGCQLSGRLDGSTKEALEPARARAIKDASESPRPRGPDEAFESVRTRSNHEASESPRIRWPNEVSESLRFRLIAHGFGEFAPLLGGVLNGETLRSLISAAGSGADSPSGLLVRFDRFKGICGLPARFTGGGMLVVWYCGLISGVGGAVFPPSDAALGASAAGTRALKGASNAGVAARLRVRACCLVGEPCPDPADAMDCRGMVERMSTDMVCFRSGDFGESMVRSGRASREGVTDTTECGLDFGRVGRPMRGKGLGGTSWLM